jgi:pantoate--beta-alanine ligase
VNKNTALTTVQQDLLSSHPLPENLHILPTTRDKDSGLALSSRNAYLSEPERKVAPVLQRALKAARMAWDSCASGAAMIEVANRVVAEEQERIRKAGEDVVLKPDYFEVFDRQTFAPFRGSPTADDKLVISGAVWVGKTRLIDNLLLGWDAETLDVSDDV